MVCDLTEMAIGSFVWVLILLFLECGLRQKSTSMNGLKAKRLNPTFSGMWSATWLNKIKEEEYECLNPTFSGMWSATGKDKIVNVEIEKS